MLKEQRSEINYIVICINEFANKFNMTPKNSYLYLKQYDGIKFLIENYQAEHTISMEDTLEDLKQICINNGGNII